MSPEGAQINYARSGNCQSVNKSVHLNLGIKAELGIIFLLSNNVAQLVQSRLCRYSKSILLRHKIISHAVNRSVSQSAAQSVSQFVSPSMSHLVRQSVALTQHVSQSVIFSQ